MKLNDYRIYDKYVFFLGSYLSNWYPCKIKYADKEFGSSEQLFMYLKAMVFDDFETANNILMFGINPAAAKNFSRQVTGFNGKIWDKHKLICMETALLYKFSQNKKLNNLFLSSEFDDKIFVEGNPHDNIWAVGLHWKDNKINNPMNWKGQNLLGKALNNVRKKLIFEQYTLFK